MEPGEWGGMSQQSQWLGLSCSNIVIIAEDPLIIYLQEVPMQEKPVGIFTLPYDSDSVPILNLMDQCTG